MVLDEHIVRAPCGNRFITIEEVDRAGKSTLVGMAIDLTDYHGRAIRMRMSGRCSLSRSLANEYLALDAAGLVAAQAVGAIIEVECDDQAVQE